MSKSRAFDRWMMVAVLVFPLFLPAIRPAEAGPPGIPEDFTGFRNPAAVYCQVVMGYPYHVVRTPGGEVGRCVMPDKSECDEWAFLDGRCGAAFGYCARIGLETSTRSNGMDPFSRDYAVCVDASRHVVRGSVTALSGLSGLSEGCGSTTGEKTPIPPEATRPRSSRTPPSSFDWRNNNGNWLSPVRDQGQCGSCWAFETVGVAESTLNIAANDPDLDPDLAEEFIVSDCYSDSAWDPYPSCCGGWPLLDFVRDAGLPDEGCFPYSESCLCDSNQNCTSDCAHSEHGCTDHLCSDRCADWQTRMRTVDTAGWVSTTSDPELLKQTALDTGPVGTSMGVGSAFGGHFDGDIYRCDDDSGSNHGVVIVGWDDDGGYWIVRNSWGSSWNGDGYFKVGYGECHIATYAYYATGSGIGSDANDDGILNAADLAETIWYIDDSGHRPIGHRDCNADITIDAQDVPCIAGLIFGG